MSYPIRYNHVGYVPQSKKIFFVDKNGVSCRGPFRILDEENVSVYEGVLQEGTFEFKGICSYSGENLWSGDFTSVEATGRYCISVVCEDGEIRSHYFDIGDGWIEGQLKANIKSFFYQRSGVDLPKIFAGKWARPAAHLDDCIGFHSEMSREGSWNAHGGWYDAGDYGKYIVNGGIAVGTLLLACLMKPDSKFINEGDCFEQPFSLKEEIRYELEFFLRMQDNDGGVFFKVSPEHWDKFVSPTESDKEQKRLIVGKSTTSTLNFAGALAQGFLVFENDDPDFASRCLGAALNAYEWAENHPDMEWPHNTEGSGAYGDERYDDEFFWARSALFWALSKAGTENCNKINEVKQKLLSDMEGNPAALGMDWRDTQNMGWILLALQEEDVDLREQARFVLENVAERILDLQRENPYGLSIRKFIWGSNGDIANHGLTLLVVNHWKNNPLLQEAAFEMLHFIYGRNPVNTCFVTGAAWSSPRFPHHRISHSDGVDEPIPGLVVGGINSDRQDLHRYPHYPGVLAGHSYTDEQCSFASNETAINWSAPLTAVLLLLCGG